MLSALFSWALSFSIVLSLLTGIYEIFAPLISKRISAKWIYYLGILFLLAPAFPIFNIQSSIPVNTPAQVSAQTGIFNSYTYLSVNTDTLYDVFDIAKYVWLMGVITVFALTLFRHNRFMKTVKRWSDVVQNDMVKGVLNEVCTELKIKKAIQVRYCPFIASPLLVGLQKPLVLLPQVDLAENELYYTLKHECVHYKSKDLLLKYLILIATAIQWYNPLVYLLARTISIQCEISCDERVVTHFDMKQRQMYLESIIGVICKNNTQWKTPLSTNYYGGKKGMEKRIKSVMSGNKKKTGVIIAASLICIIALVIVLSFNFARMWNFNVPETLGTKLELTAAGNQKTGFQSKQSIYTDGNATDISLHGKITVNGTAELEIVSDEDGSVVFTNTFTAAKDQTVKVDLKNLTPNSYYTLTFSSNDANNGKLTLESDQSLVKSPEKPERHSK